MNSRSVQALRRSRPVSSVLMALAVAVLHTGCGNLVAGGFSDVEVVVSGDAPDPQGVGAVLPTAVAHELRIEGVSATDGATTGKDQPEGEMEAEFTLALESSDGSLVDLSSQPVRLRLDLEGRQELDAVRATVPADSYVALLVVFTDFEIEVDAGLVIGGTLVTGSIEVELDDGLLPVRKSLSLSLQDGDQVELLVDMNAATWLQAVDPDLRTVAETVVENAITVVIR